MEWVIYLNLDYCQSSKDFIERIMPNIQALTEGEGNEIDAVILTHAHVDHVAYIHYLRPDIPIYCSEATRLIMQAFQDTGSLEEYVTFKENFMVRLNRFGDLSKIAGKEMSYPRKFRIFDDSKKFTIGSVEVEPFRVDHSLPGACGLVIYTSMGVLVILEIFVFMVAGE